MRYQTRWNSIQTESNNVQFREWISLSNVKRGGRGGVVPLTRFHASLYRNPTGIRPRWWKKKKKSMRENSLPIARKKRKKKKEERVQSKKYYEKGKQKRKGARRLENTKQLKLNKSGVSELSWRRGHCSLAALAPPELDEKLSGTDHKKRGGHCFPRCTKAADDGIPKFRCRAEIRRRVVIKSWSVVCVWVARVQPDLLPPPSSLHPPPTPLFLTNLTYECDHRSDPFLWSTGNDSLNRFIGDGRADVAVRLDFHRATASIISRPARNPFRMQPGKLCVCTPLRSPYTQYA